MFCTRPRALPIYQAFGTRHPDTDPRKDNRIRLPLQHIHRATLDTAATFFFFFVHFFVFADDVFNTSKTITPSLYSFAYRRFRRLSPASSTGTRHGGNTLLAPQGERKQLRDHPESPPRWTSLTRRADYSFLFPFTNPPLSSLDRKASSSWAPDLCSCLSAPFP